MNKISEIKNTLRNTFKNSLEIFTTNKKYNEFISKIEFNSCHLHNGLHFSHKRKSDEDNEIILNAIKRDTGLDLSRELIKVLSKINDTSGLWKDIQFNRNSSFKEIFLVLNTFYNADLYKIKIEDIIYLTEVSEYINSLSE